MNSKGSPRNKPLQLGWLFLPKSVSALDPKKVCRAGMAPFYQKQGPWHHLGGYIDVIPMLSNWRTRQGAARGLCPTIFCP